jgi:glycosyltransferase involved in cell wall biosynthesis
MNAPWKGFAIAADWAARSAGAGVCWGFYGDVHPSIAGDVARLRAAANPALAFRGRMPTTRIFDEVDVLVHASTEFDPFPTVLLEAARAGIPVVASSLGGSAEIVEQGTTGYLFEPGEPEAGFVRLEELLRSRERRETMGLAARARYEARFTVSRMTQDYAAFWSGASR